MEYLDSIIKDKCHGDIYSVKEIKGSAEEIRGMLG